MPLRLGANSSPNGGAADHPDPDVNLALLADSLSTGDLVFARKVMEDLSKLAGEGNTLTAHDLNGALSVVRAIGPRDPTEALLASQMAAIHQATMKAASVLSKLQMSCLFKLSCCPSRLVGRLRTHWNTSRAKPSYVYKKAYADALQKREVQRQKEIRQYVPPKLIPIQERIAAARAIAARSGWCHFFAACPTW
jgi:hypothetical protein